MTEILIRVEGIPRPGGSKRSFRHPHTGKIIVIDASKTVKVWRALVVAAAKAAYRGPPLQGPLHVSMQFFLMRPKAHYKGNNRGNDLRFAAPAEHVIRPDVLKLCRPTEDALTNAGVWGDDAQIVNEIMTKTYSRTDTPGALILISTL